MESLGVGVAFGVGVEYLQFKMMVAHLNGCWINFINCKNPLYV